MARMTQEEPRSGTRERAADEARADEAARARRRSGRRLLVAGLLLWVLAALLPVIATVLASGALQTIGWLSSMPLCLLGAALGAMGIMRLRRREEDSY